jgi:hypothetical protein
MILKTKPIVAAKGVGLWAIAMIVPFLLWYINSGKFKTMVFLIYPVIVSILSRNGYFWISPEILAFSSILAFGYGTLIRINKDVRDAMDNPREKKALSAVTLTSIAVVFLGCVMLLGLYAIPMYRPSNFAA